MTHRFFVPAGAVCDDRVTFTEDQRKQMRNVLRLRPGDVVAALDGSGLEYAVEIRELGAQAWGSVVGTRNPETEPDVRVTVIQGMPKGEKPDLILQKCTEVGASEFVFMETSRSVPRVPPERLQGKLRRWEAIVREAAEQSGRTRLPTVEGVVRFEDALARAKKSDVAVIAWEGEHGRTLLSELARMRQAKSVAYLVGPEGGFSEGEIASAVEHGIVPVSLGKRVLRAETAAIVGTALVVYGVEERALFGGTQEP